MDGDELRPEVIEREGWTIEELRRAVAAAAAPEREPCHFHEGVIAHWQWGGVPLCEACWERTMEEVGRC